MAVITSAGTGNWNTGGTWVGGIVPTAGDNVVIVSVHNVTANVDINVASIYCNTGYLTVAATRQITMTGAGLSVNTGASASGVGGIDITGSGIAVTITGLGLTGDIRAAIRVAGTNVVLTLVMTGTLAGVTHNSDGISPALVNVIGANCTVNYTGSMVNTSLTVSSLLAGIRVSATGCTVNYLGTISNGTYSSILTVSDTVVNFNGALTGSNYAAISCTLATGQLNIQGTVSQSGNINPFYSRVINVAGPLQWNISGGNLYTAGGLTGYPLENKVENGEVYGPSGEFEGTLDPVTISTGQVADISNAIASHITPQVLAAVTQP